jgi:outer membrane protein TolC
MRRALVALGLLAPAAAAQAPARDSLRLGDLQAEALRADPRLSQLALEESRTALRLRGLHTERLPALSLDGQAQYQSDVVELQRTLPPGVPGPQLPHDTYDSYLTAQQRLYDPTLAPRRSLERARLGEQQARVRTALYARRQEVNDAFFTALLLQTRAAELALAITDLEAQRAVVADRVRNGVALPSEEATLRAAQLRRRQDLAALRADRRAALAVLARLTGRALDTASALATPALGDPEYGAPDSTTVRARPEFAQFARTRERLTSQEAVATAQERPRVSAYGRAGYGKPGLNFLNTSFDTYWIVGLRVQWTPWTWGAAEREREGLALERRIVETEEQAFADAIARATERDAAAIDRLEAVLPMDAEIIALRERIEREARARLREGVVTAAEYVDRRTDVTEARLARAGHEAELAQARARLLTTLGLEVR